MNNFLEMKEVCKSELDGIRNSCVTIIGNNDRLKLKNSKLKEKNIILLSRNKELRSLTSRLRNELNNNRMLVDYNNLMDRMMLLNDEYMKLLKTNSDKNSKFIKKFNNLLDSIGNDSRVDSMEEMLIVIRELLSNNI